jgi:hypothetical protein
MTLPSLKIHVNGWSILDEADPFTEEGLLYHLRVIKEAGFQSYCGSTNSPGIKGGLAGFGLEFGGAFDANSVEEMPDKIADCSSLGNAPVNCQLGNHDTPLERAIELTIALMEEGKRQGVEVHLEMHRDTCTETPEKTYAIIDGYKKATGEYPLVNFDYSHPAIVKHLMPENYIDRLFENIPCFQQSTLWHIRPFNGHHCQIPITDGQGNFSPEYEDCRPFIRQALQHWLDGPRPGNKLWVVPEQGTRVGYNLSCFPNIWEDTVVLGKDIQAMWKELVGS